MFSFFNCEIGGPYEFSSRTFLFFFCKFLITTWCLKLWLEGIYTAVVGDLWIVKKRKNGKEWLDHLLQYNNRNRDHSGNCMSFFSGFLWARIFSCSSVMNDLSVNGKSRVSILLLYSGGRGKELFSYWLAGLIHFMLLFYKRRIDVLESLLYMYKIFQL